jgi:putative phosphoesterase
MLIAFISDMHGNLPALEAAIDAAEKQGVDAIYCAGDMTGYGPFPDDVCRVLMDRNIPAIIGNYDGKVVAVAEKGSAAAAGMKRKKRKILLWTAAHVSRRSKAYLSGLPESIDMQLPSGHELLVVHGSPLSADDAIYPSITKEGLIAKLNGLHPDVLICGHTHIPFARHIGTTLVVNCGSAGHPVDGDPRLSYALVSVEKGALPHGQIIRADYDRERTIAKLKKSSLPKGLQKDFAKGIKRRFLE